MFYERKEEMKNTFLKKVGAVALAAVMAVTFAPVASLDVFAATIVPIEKNGAYVLTGSSVSDTYSVVSSGTFVVSGDGIGITVNGGDKVKINLGNSKNVKITLADVSSKTSIEVIGNRNGIDALTDTVSVNKVEFDGGVKSCAGLKFTGTMELKVQAANNDLETGRFAHSYKSVFGSTPVAFSSKNAGVYMVGQDAIDAQVIKQEASIEAVNGAVKAKGLTKGNTAKVYTGAAVNTTIDATAAKDTSLTKVVTKYNYEFWTSANSNEGNYGKSQYTDTKFAAGAANWADAVDGEPDACYTVTGTTCTNAITGAQISTKALSVTGYVTGFEYERAITLKQDDNDKYEGVEVSYLDPQKYANGKAHAHNDYRDGHDGASGITYFTSNPTSVTNKENGVAVLDGEKFIIDDYDRTLDGESTQKGQLETVSGYATKTLAVLRGTSKDETPENAMNPIAPKPGIKVTAPTTSSIVIGHYTVVRKSGESGAQQNRGFVYGSRHVEGVNSGKEGRIFQNTESAALSDTVIRSSLEVPQVADGTYAVVLGAFADTEVTKADSLGYFYEQKTDQIAANKANFVFAAPVIAKSAFNSVLSGDLMNGTTYFTKAVGGETVYASKEIKGKFKNANAKVNVLGEISAVVDAKNVWTVNEGYASAGVTAYRMYRKSGEHVYTINPVEVTMLENAGWINEGPAFKVNSVASQTGTPIYRVYNKNNGGMHFYTANAAEKDMLLANGWTEGKVVFYGATKDQGIPVYRIYNTGSNNGEHNYTTNIAEADMNVKAGWRAEGVAFYVFK